MTAVVAFHLGDYIVAAADTREMSGDNFRDDVVKIVRREWGGFATGAGLVPLLDEVKQWFATEDHLLLDSIPPRVQAASQVCRARYAFSPRAEVDDWLRNTNFVIAVASGSGDSQHLRLLRVNGLSYDIDLRPKHSVLVIQPADVSRSTEDEIRGFANEWLNMVLEQEDVHRRVGLALDGAMICVGLFARESGSVSNSASVVVVDQSGRTELFDPVDTREAVEFILRQGGR